MAQALRFVCDGCDRAVESWSDGNPYFFDSAGKKQYAHHPDHERLALCVGNDSPHICLACGIEFMVDSRAPLQACPDCKSGDMSDAFQLDGRPCPYCKAGSFAVDPDFFCIS